MTQAFVKTALDATRTPQLLGAYVLVHGTPGDGSQTFVSAELDARDGAKPFIADFGSARSPVEVKSAMDEILASGQSVVASGIDHLDAPAFKAVVTGLEQIAATGRHAVAVAKGSIEGKDLGNVFYVRFDAAAHNAIFAETVTTTLSESLKARLTTMRQGKDDAQPASPSSPASPM